MGARFAALAAEGRKALVVYITAGHPDPQRSVELMRAAVTFEAKALDKSIDSIMGALPRPLRAVTKKIMFGGR